MAPKIAIVYVRCLWPQRFLLFCHTDCSFSTPCTATSRSSPKLSSKASSLPAVLQIYTSKTSYSQSFGSSLTGFSRVQETLPEEVLTKMHAPPKDSSIPTITPAKLQEYDAVLFGIPTRYGNFPAQFKAFFDATGGQWQSGSFWGKYAGLFVSTAGLGGGQESTCIAALSTLVHHGMIYVPLGYKKTFAQLTNLSEVHGGSPWGAGTFAVSSISSRLSSFSLPCFTITQDRN